MNNRQYLIDFYLDLLNNSKRLYEQEKITEERHEENKKVIIEKLKKVLEEKK